VHRVTYWQFLAAASAVSALKGPSNRTSRSILSNIPSLVSHSEQSAACIFECRSQTVIRSSGQLFFRTYIPTVIEVQFHLIQCQKVAEEHGYTTVTREADYLAATKCGLRPDRLWHRVRHRAVIEGAQDPALAVHLEITRGPYDLRAHVTGEGCVFGGNFVDGGDYELRANR
jgi:hypothetical protein